MKHIQLQTLFAIGEFEYSLIHAHQGFRKHPTTELEHGILQGNETIEDCIGIDTSPITLQLLYPWIRELQEYRKYLVEKLKEEVDELAGMTFGRVLKLKISKIVADLSSQALIRFDFLKKKEN